MDTYALGLLEEAALDFANALRKRAGAEPADVLRPGFPQDAQFCPIARTAGHGWQVAQLVAVRWAHGTVVDTAEVPVLAAQFVEVFDSGVLSGEVVA